MSEVRLTGTVIGQAPHGGWVIEADRRKYFASGADLLVAELTVGQAVNFTPGRDGAGPRARRVTRRPDGEPRGGDAA